MGKKKRKTSKEQLTWLIQNRTNNKISDEQYRIELETLFYLGWDLGVTIGIEDTLIRLGYGDKDKLPE